MADAEVDVQTDAGNSKRPSLTAWGLIAAGLLGLTASAYGVRAAGVGLDAFIDIDAATETRSLPVGSSLSQAYEAVYYTAEFYGISVVQLAEILKSVFGFGSGFLKPGQLGDYRWMAVVNVALTVVGAVSLAIAVFVVFRSMLAATFTWALLMVTPLLVGSAHVNWKDVPVATGLSMVSSGLIIAYAGRSGSARWVGGMALTAPGASIAMTGRPASWALVLLLVAGSGVTLLGADVLRRRLRSASAWPVLASGVVAVAAGLLALWLTNPFGRIDLFRWLWDSATVMSRYPIELEVLTLGQPLLSTGLPWWYVPVWFLAQTPIFTLLLLAVTTFVIGAAILGRTWAPRKSSLVTLSPLMWQGVLIPAGIVISGAVLYDGIRQVLFMVPALVAITSVGVAAAEEALGGQRSQWVRQVAPAAAILVVTASLIASVRWIPYSYAYINPVAGWEKVDRQWDLDYWGVTAFEGVNRLKATGLEWIAVVPFANSSFMMGAGWESDVAESTSGDFGKYAFLRWDSSVGDCERLFVIERAGHVLGEGGRCASDS